MLEVKKLNIFFNYLHNEFLILTEVHFANMLQKVMIIARPISGLLCFETIPDAVTQNSIMVPCNMCPKLVTPIPFLHIPNNVLCYLSNPFLSGCNSQSLLNSDILKIYGLQVECEYF
jgi:hypothetical protein